MGIESIITEIRCQIDAVHSKYQEIQGQKPYPHRIEAELRVKLKVYEHMLDYILD